MSFQLQNINNMNFLRHVIPYYNISHLILFPDKTNDSILSKTPKSSLMGHFGPFLSNFDKTRIFPKNRAPSLLNLYRLLTSCQRTDKTNEHILRKKRYTRTNGRTREQADEQENKRTNAQELIGFFCKAEVGLEP